MKKLFTVGYEGTDVDRFLKTLVFCGVETVADVRAVAQSRKPGFSKIGLERALDRAGLEYQHFVELGDPKPGRDAARRGDYNLFRSVYHAHLATDEPQRALDRLQALALSVSTCLLCFERDPLTCHRSIVAAELRPHGLEIVHLAADRPEVYDLSPSHLARRHSREGAAPS